MAISQVEEFLQGGGPQVSVAQVASVIRQMNQHYQQQNSDSAQQIGALRQRVWEQEVVCPSLTPSFLSPSFPLLVELPQG